MIETKIYCYKGTSSISGSAMNLLIILTFCLGFVVCRDNLMFILPNETGPAPKPAIYRSAPAVPDEVPNDKAGNKVFFRSLKPKYLLTIAGHLNSGLFNPKLQLRTFQLL